MRCKGEIRVRKVTPKRLLCGHTHTARRSMFIDSNTIQNLPLYAHDTMEKNFLYLFKRRREKETSFYFLLPFAGGKKILYRKIHASVDSNQERLLQYHPGRAGPGCYSTMATIFHNAITA